MTTDLIIAALCLGCGFVCANLKSKSAAYISSAAIPWASLLGFLLYQEHFVPYRGGGASMWPIVQLLVGTLMAVLGFIACFITRRFFLKSK